MSKERRIRFSLFSWVMAGVALLFGSCLNPVSFNPDDLPTIKVEVSGSLTIDDTAKVKLDDVAVMWLINRTNSVNVTNFSITRPAVTEEEKKDEFFPYPKEFSGQPEHGSSLATYHIPMETPYTISVSWARIDGSEPGTWTKDVQFPRPQDYRFYLYRTNADKVIVVDENEMKEVPDPNDTTTDPADPSKIDAQTFVVINVTPNQNIDGVQFVKTPNTYVVFNEPKAKDQKMILLSAGSYVTTATYTKNGTSLTTDTKNVVVTKENGSMAVRTNFVYFYKTKSGDYQLSQTWPPRPNDAADDNSPQDALNDGQGILEITNNATPALAHDIIARVNINGDEYPDDNPNNLAYMVPGDVNTYILSVGTAYVLFKPTDQTYYGQTIPREITSKAVTKLSYTNNMGNPAIPEDPTGNGAGLIRITNKTTTGVVNSVTVYDRADLSKFLSIAYEDFTPPYPINFGNKVGLVPVYGTAEVPLNTGVNQIIQVLLETNDGMAVVERVAALRGQIVDIVIEEAHLNPSNRIGSKVTVSNSTSTPTTIVNMYVYNQANPASTAMYYLDISNPASKSVYVLSSNGLPIVDGQTYKATLSVYGNGNFALIEKDFVPDGYLYSTDPDGNSKMITLTDADLPTSLKEQFVEVTGITTSPTPYSVNVYYTTDLDGTSNPVVVAPIPDFNLTSIVTVAPANATTKGPIVWSLVSGGDSKISLNSGGDFRVNGFVTAGAERTVRVQATINNAAGTAAAKTPFTGTVDINLVYNHYGYTTKKVNGFTLTGVTIEEGTTLDLRTLVASIDPPNANISGVPITKNDLDWSIDNNNGTGSMIIGSTLTAGTPGTIKVKATMPAAKTDSGADKTVTQEITIQMGPPPFVSITGITMQAGFSGILNYYTRTVGATKTVYASDTLALGVTITPSTATNQSPLNWFISSGPAGAVDLTLNPDQLKVKIGGVPPASNTVGVKVTVPNGTTTGDFTSGEFTITLVEHHSKPVQPGDIQLKTATIDVGQAVTLSTLVTGFPSDANLNGAPITKADLVWSIESGPAYGSLSSDNLALTGTAAGEVWVRATLPGSKNLGTEVSATTKVTVNTPQPTYPTSVTFRLFKVKEAGDSYDDAVIGIYWGMAKYPDPTFSDTPTNIAVKKGLGHTGIWWAGNTSVTKYKHFYTEYMKPWYYPYCGYIGNLSLKASGTSMYDMTLNWPLSGYTGYNIFFHEKDDNIRGYANPWGKIDPANNYVFYLDFKYLYENKAIWMVGNKRVAEGTAGAKKVIPIYYNSQRNVGAVPLTPAIGASPVYGYGDLTK